MVLALKALVGIVLRETVFASVSSCRWANETSTRVGQVAQQRVGSALQTVLRFPRGCCHCFALHRRMDVVVNARGTCLVHFGILWLCARQ